MAIYIPIALAIKYWQWTLLIGSLVLLTVGMLKLIDRERRESRELDDLVARDVLRRRGRPSQTQLGHHQGSAAADREQPAMPASEVPATSDSVMQSPPGPLAARTGASAWNPAWVVGGVVLLLFIIGIARGGEKSVTPTPTTTAPQAQTPAAPVQVTVPGDLVGKDARHADDEFRRLGIGRIIYASQDAASKVAQDWTVTKVEPAPGTVVLTTDTVVVTAIKKPDLVLPVAPPAAPPAAVAPLPADTSPGSSTGPSAYYPNCAAARAAGVAPLHRGEPGYRSGLDRDGDGIACE
jgi:hypothetical protein